MKSLTNNLALKIASKTAISLTLIAGLSIAPIASAQAFNKELYGADESRHSQRLLASLDLTDQQKQDILQIRKQLKQDNSVFTGEKQSLRTQMRLLMEQESWDEALAQSLVTEQVEQGMSVQFNIAKARNATFNVLDEGQQAEFLQKQAARSTREHEQRGLNFERMAKRLQLSESQIDELASIQEQTTLANAANKAGLKANKAQEKAIVYASNFDEDAWLALQEQSKALRIETGLIGAHGMYQMLAVLSDEQREKFEDMKQRKDAKKGKRKG